MPWIERRPAGDVAGMWSVVSDCYGLKLIAANYGGRLYTSPDGGETWVERRPLGDVNRLWVVLASDRYGLNLVVEDYHSEYPASLDLYTSPDGGETWIKNQLAGPEPGLSTTASDDDGSNLITGHSRLYTSPDGGETWVERQPAGDVDQRWMTVTSDKDGLKLGAASGLIDGHPELLGRLYTSPDGGETWVERRPAGDVDLNWSLLASDRYGLKLVAGAFPGRLYTSPDGGETWVERRPLGDVDAEWCTAASDDDMSNLIVGAWHGRLYTSPDGGDTWVEKQLAGDFDLLWNSVASDGDGSNLVATAWGGPYFYPPDSGGRLYTYALLSGPTAIFDPNRGLVGADVDASGNTWIPDETIISVSVGGEPATNALVVDEGGILSGTFTIPAITDGLKDVVITGSLSGARTFSNAVTVVNVGAPRTVYVIEDFAGYMVYIRFVDPPGIPFNFDEIEAAVRAMVPAHLGLYWIFASLTWDVLDALNLTWDQLDALNLTWDQLEVLA